MKLDAATSVTAPAASQPAPGARETTQKAVSTTEMCWVAPNLSAPSAMDVKPWQSLNASAPRFEGPQILFGARKTPQVLAGRAKPQCSPQGFVLEGSDRPAPPRSVGQSHRPAGSWAYDHGVAAHLSCDANIRVKMLSFVSALDILTRPVRSIRGWPYLRLRELRVCAAKLVFASGLRFARRSSEQHPHRLRSRGRRSPRARHSGKVFG